MHNIIKDSTFCVSVGHIGATLCKIEKNSRYPRQCEHRLLIERKYIKKALFRHNILTFEMLNFGTDIGTEELGHLEMVGTLVHQLTRNLNEEQIKAAGFDAYFVDHTTGVFPQFASGTPWTAATMQVTGDTIADLTEDLAADGAIA